MKEWHRSMDSWIECAMLGRKSTQAQATAHAEALPQSTAWRSRLLGEQTRVTGAQGVGTGLRGNEEAEEAEKG